MPQVLPTTTNAPSQRIWPQQRCRHTMYSPGSCLQTAHKRLEPQPSKFVATKASSAGCIIAAPASLLLLYLAAVLWLCGSTCLALSQCSAFEPHLQVV
jgi:hypothetical protein